MHHDNRLGDPSQREFDFRSCSSAVTADVMFDQIPKLKGDQEVITLSAGRLHEHVHRQISLTHHFRWQRCRAHQSFESMRLSMVGLGAGGNVCGQDRSGKYQLALGHNRLGHPRTGL
jgi:hypothetical protein